MRWNSIKSVMIAILLVVNVWLIYLLAERGLVQNYFSADALENAVEILGRSGISMTVDQLDPKKRDAAVYGADMHEDYYADIAERLAASTVSETFPTPSGVRMITENRATVSFTHTFGINYLAADGDRTAMRNIVESALASGEPMEARQRVLRPLRALLEAYLAEALQTGTAAQSGHARLCFDGVFRFDDYYLFRCSQELDGKPIDGHRVDCLFDAEGNLLWLDGTWSFLPLTRNYSAQLYDQINILFKEKAALDEWRMTAQTDDPMTLSRMEFCYVYSVLEDEQTEEKHVYYAPAWQIAYSDGTVRTYNAVTGESAKIS
ncbi:MAG: hypothetical protein IKD37_09085 [Clostridia bacterium]|nr:hypothetical protein [Clostridia bacterium]